MGVEFGGTPFMHTHTHTHTRTHTHLAARGGSEHTHTHTQTSKIWWKTPFKNALWHFNWSLQNIVCFIGLFCKRDLSFYRSWKTPFKNASWHFNWSLYVTSYLIPFTWHFLWFFYVTTCLTGHWYGVATVSRIDKMIALVCRISSVLYGSFAKETYNLIDPTMGWLRLVGFLKW